MLLKEAFLFFFAGSLCLLAPQTSRAQRFETGSLRWIDENRETVLTSLLPFVEYADVSFRVYGDAERDVLEYSCSMKWNWTTKEVEAVIRLADSTSLYYQVVDLHRKNPTWTIEQVKKHLKVKEWHLTNQSCPVLKERFLKFGRLCFPVETEDDQADREAGREYVVLHAINFHFDMWMWGGNVKLDIYDLTPQHPLQTWAKDTRRALDSCASNNSEQKK
jgi:hypothetical protein